MKSLERIKLLKEHAQLVQIIPTLKAIEKIKSLKRLGEIIVLLGGKTDNDKLGEPAPSKKTPLDLSEIQPLQIDDPTKIKKAVERYLSQFKDKYITTIDGKNVIFNRKGREHLVNDVLHKEKLLTQAIGKVVEVLTQGQFVEVQELTKNRRDSFVAFHVYRKWVLIDNQELHLQIKVGQLKDGTFEIGNGLIVYSAKNAEAEDKKKVATPPVSPSFDSLPINREDCYLDTKSIPHWQNAQLLGEALSVKENAVTPLATFDNVPNSGAYRTSFNTHHTAFDTLSQAEQDDYVFIEILEVRPLVSSENQNTLLANENPVIKSNDDLVTTLTQMIQTSGRVELTSLPKTIDYNKLKKAIMVVFKDSNNHLRDTEIFCRPLNANVKVRMSSAKHILNNGATRDKMLLLLKTLALISGAKSVIELENDSEQRNIENVFLISTPISLNGQAETVNQIVVKDNQGNYVYDLYIRQDGATSNKYKIKENGLKAFDDIHHVDFQAIATLGVPTGEAIKQATSFPILPNADGEILPTADDNVNNQFDNLGGDMVLNLFFNDELSQLLEKTATTTPTAYQLSDKPTVASRQKDNDKAVALMRELQETGRKATPEEKVILSKYTGTGGNLVGEDGLKGSAYEYYTPIEVANSMWDLLKESGFNGGMVLDPSAGTGIFKASAPKDILMHSVELSDISGQINALINDDDRHSVTISPFEKVASSTDDETMDAVMTNVPFGDVSARGENRFFDNKYQNDSLEEYFIKRSLDKLKPNGLAMFIVPTKILDGKNYAKFRQSVLLRADLLGAYRLPNKVFDKTGADVTTDIVVFKKFSRDVKDKIDNLHDNGGLATLKQAKVLDSDIILGKYFKTYGKHFVLGTAEKGKGRYGDVVRVVNDDSLPNILKLVKKLPDSRIDYDLLGATDFVEQIAFNDGDVRVLDGQTFEYQQGGWRATQNQVKFDERPFASFDDVVYHKVKKADITAYRGYLASVGRKMPDWLDVLDSNSKDDNALYYWAVLNAVSEALKREMPSGYASRYPELTKAMRGILGDYLKNTYKTKNSQFKALHKAVAVAFDMADLSTFWYDGQKTALQDTVLNSQQAYENAVYRGQADNWQVDVATIQITDPDFNPLANDDFCINADGTKVTLARDYYSGNYGEFLAKIDNEINHATDPKIKEKLLKQKAFAETLIDFTDVYKLNFGLLSTMIPFEMKYRFFNEFVDSRVILTSDGEKSKLGIDAKNLTDYDDAEDTPQNSETMRYYLLNRIFISINNGQKLSIHQSSTPKSDYPILTQKLIQYFNELNINFNAWLKTQKDFMAELDYQFNGPVNKTFPTQADGSAFEIDNFNPKYENFSSLHDYQFEEVRRLSRSFSGICGFDVGLGKTATSLATIQNMHNIGVKKRTFIVVPNHTISKWAKDIKNVYDDVSDVLVIGTNNNQNDSSDSKYNAHDFALLAKKEGSGYRKILMTVEAFSSIPMRKQHLIDYFGEEASERKADNEKQKGKQSSIVKALNKYEGKLPYFEDLAVDSLVFDEAQLFKNGKAGGKDFNRIKGLAQKDANGLSSRALSARVKSWWVRGHNKQTIGIDDGVVLLTATPFTNSPTEIMTMLSLAIGDDQANRLFGGGAIKDMNDFLSMFANIESLQMSNMIGELVSNDVFTGFNNVQLLKDKIHQVANIQTAKERGLKIPSEEHTTTSIDLPSDDKAMLDKMKLFYKIAKAEAKDDTVFLVNIPQEVYAEYLNYKEQVNEPDEVIGHAFNLISRMSDLTLLGADMALKRNVVLDFEPKELNLAYQVAQSFNKKNYKFSTTRNYPLSDDMVEMSIKTNQETGDSEVEYKVRAVVSVDDKKNQLILNVDDATMLAHLMSLIDKQNLTIKPKLSAKAQALIDNVKLELSQPKHQGHAKQLIFCDTLSMHQIIKKALTAYAGIAQSQIAILNAQTLPSGESGNPDTEHVQEIQDLFADNTYTIVIANKKAETGIDLQKGTQAIHHLTTGWTPDSLQQRNGRGVRQGNTQETVTIYHYNANGTFDEYKRHLISGKADWIGSLMDKTSQISGTLTVHQELSEQDYEDLIEADSAEKISQLLAKKAEREETERKARVQAKNTFIFNNMLKAKQNAQKANFDTLLQETMLRELNIMVDLVRSNAGGREQKQKRIDKAKQMMNQFAGLPDGGVGKLWALVEKTAGNNKNSRAGKIDSRDIKDALVDEKAIRDEMNLGYSPTSKQWEELTERKKQALAKYFDEDVGTMAHERIKNIISSAIEMQNTTAQAFINNDDSEFSRDERMDIVSGVVAVENGQLVRHLDLFKFEVGDALHYAVAQVKNGELTYRYSPDVWRTDLKFVKLDTSEQADAIDYMVNHDFEKAKASDMQMSSRTVFSNLLPDVHNLVQQKIRAVLEDWENEEVALPLKGLVDKASGRLYGLHKWWAIFSETSHNKAVQTAYYQPFSDFKHDDENAFILRKDLDKYDKVWGGEYDFYQKHLKPFLLANNLKLSLSPDFKQSPFYAMFNSALAYFSYYSTLDGLDIKKSDWAVQARYDEAISKAAHFLFGQLIDNVDELVEKLGLGLFDDDIQKAIVSHIGELSLDGQDPKQAKRQALKDEVAQNAVYSHKNAKNMIAYKSSSNDSYTRKKIIALGYDEVKYNKAQQAFYIPAGIADKLIDEMTDYELNKTNQFVAPQNL